MIRTITQSLLSFGFNPQRFVFGVRSVWKYISDYARFRAAGGVARDWPLGAPLPCLGDHLVGNGSTRGHYFIQDLVVARRVLEHAPRRHIDVGSRVDGFIAHVAASREIEVIDCRATSAPDKNIRTIVCDMSDLPVAMKGICDSVSCLHALEHFGLGRYGDVVSASSYERGLDGLLDLLTPGGMLYLSVPIGRQRIEYNAHRVFSPRTILSMLGNRGQVSRFSYIDDFGTLVEDCSLSEDFMRRADKFSYSCGIFEIRKK